VGSLLNGGSAWLTLTGTAASSAAGGNITNHATETQTEYPNATISDAKIYVKEAVLTVTNTPNLPSVNVGDVTSFTLNVSNGGPDTVSNVNITDLIPAGFTYNTYTSSIPGSYNSATGLWTVGSLLNGGSAWLTLTGTAAASIAGSNITNHATETQTEYPNTVTIPDAKIYVKMADVQLSQVGGCSGNNVTFNVTASNGGPDAAHNVTITDAIPSGLSNPIVSVTSGIYTITNGVITWTLDLNSGANATLTLNGTAAGQSTVYNVANKTNQTEYDPTTPDVTNCSIYVSAVSISVYNNLWYYLDNEQVYQTSYVVGNTFETMWSALNSASYDEATGVVLQYIIPKGLLYVGSNSYGIGTITYSYNSTSQQGVLTWNVSYMPKGGWVTAYVVLTVMGAGNYTADLTTTANLVHVDQVNLNPSKNQNKNCSITSPASADVQVNQSYTKYTQNGNTYVTYTITATNNGPGNATGVQVTDKLPAGLTYVSNTSNGSYNSTSGVWNISNLNNGTSTTITITALITAKTGTIINTATKTAENEYDPNLNNDAQTTYLKI
jgi:uncharacterized repeat protein (TIGR01451 family)